MVGHRKDKTNDPAQHKLGKMVTFMMYPSEVNALNEMVKRGFYYSRSEIIRAYIKEGLIRDENFIKMIRALDNEEDFGNEILTIDLREFTVVPRDQMDKKRIDDGEISRI